MKATPDEQIQLLELSILDVEIARTRASLSNLSSGLAFAENRSQQRELAGKLIESRNALDSVELELSRADSDLKLVEQRIDKDKLRINQTSSPKDAQGIQSELETLAKRKSDLEDLELSIMERKEQCEAEFKIVSLEKATVDGELADLESANELQILKIRSGLDLATSKRAQESSRINSELLELYEKKNVRGVAVGRLVNRECGACRMTVGATALAEISALPKDVVATCPDCQAFLIR